MCGDKSNPFRYPLLSEKEVQSFIAVCEQPFSIRLSSDGGPKSWAARYLSNIVPETLARARTVNYSDAKIFSVSSFSHYDRSPLETNRR